MIGTILMWLALIYIGLIVLWRLFVMIALIFSEYEDRGLGGAISAALLLFLLNVWDLVKFAIGILIIALIMRSCA